VVNAQDKFTSLRLHPETTESLCLMLNRIKIHSHLHHISILTVLSISQDFHRSSFSSSNESCPLNAVEVQYTCSLLTSKLCFFQTRRLKSFLKPVHGNSRIYLKRGTPVSSLRTREAPSLPHVRPHNTCKSLAPGSRLPPTGEPPTGFDKWAKTNSPTCQAQPG